MLALALSVLVLTAVGMAIHLHLRVLDVGRTEVEEAQLARALLTRIASDLRSAVPYKPLDAEKLVSGAAAAAEGAVAAETGEEGGTSTAQKATTAEKATAATASSDSGTSESAELDLAQSVVPRSVPGLFGNRYQLQVDMSRLPRIDQFDAMLMPDAAATSADRLSDVKTVAYYVIAPGEAGFAGATADAQEQTGLVRRELDRAITAWAEQQGQSAELNMGAELIAPEVTAIEFQYYSGGEVFEEWDSEAQGGLPTAVEIALAITPARQANQQRAWWQVLGSASTEEVQPLVYRLLVHLPASEAVATEAGSSAGEESSDMSEESATDSSKAQDTSQDTSKGGASKGTSKGQGSGAGQGTGQGSGTGSGTGGATGGGTGTGASTKGGAKK